MSLVAMTSGEVVVLGVNGRAIGVDGVGGVGLDVEATVGEVKVVVDEVEAVVAEVLVSPFARLFLFAPLISFLGLNPDLC